MSTQKSNGDIIVRYVHVLNGKFCKGSVKGAKRRRITVKRSKLVEGGRLGAKIRNNPLRTDVQQRTAKKKRSERVKLKLKRTLEFKRVKKRDENTRKVGQREQSRRETDIGRFTWSKDRSFRWRDIELPDAELSTVTYATGKIKRWFKYPVAVHVGVLGYDDGGNPVGSRVDKVVWGESIVSTALSLAKRLKQLADQICAKYAIKFVARLFIHISESNNLVKFYRERAEDEGEND
jgi:hypothetical protein